MSPLLILSVIFAYFGLLLTVAWWTGRKGDNADFYIGGRKSPWFLVAFGMIGASLSGVTFISVPGWVGNTHFFYYQMVLGYIVGYIIISEILMPVYYKKGLTSIYTYLSDRFGFFSYKTGAGFFLLSRVIGAAFRLFLVAGVLQTFVFDQWNVPFWITVSLTLLLIWIYTFRGGIRTIVYTDTLQTAFMLIAVVLTVVFISMELNLSFGGLVDTIAGSAYSQVFDWDWQSASWFPKHFVGGALVAATMTGLDQDMMQKNLSCKNLSDGQKNIRWQAVLFPAVNVIFLSLGVLLLIYAQQQYQIMNGASLDVSPGQMPGAAIAYLGEKSNIDIAVLNEQGSYSVATDNLFPMIALNFLPTIVGVIFIVGLIAAAYSSADSALTALTTSFCIDILGFNPENTPRKTRYMVHVGFSVVLLLLILIFQIWDNRAVIGLIFKAATYTYGPLLGLFTFGLFTKRALTDKWAPLVCIGAPVICFLIEYNQEYILGGYKIGYEMLAFNGLITFLGLWMLSKPSRKEVDMKADEAVV